MQGVFLCNFDRVDFPVICLWHFLLPRIKKKKYKVKLSLQMFHELSATVKSTGSKEIPAWEEQNIEPNVSPALSEMSAFLIRP